MHPLEGVYKNKGLLVDMTAYARDTKHPHTCLRAADDSYNLLCFPEVNQQVLSYLNN